MAANPSLCLAFEKDGFSQMQPRNIKVDSKSFWMTSRDNRQKKHRSFLAIRRFDCAAGGSKLLLREIERRHQYLLMSKSTSETFNHIWAKLTAFTRCEMESWGRGQQNCVHFGKWSPKLTANQF